MKYLIVLFCLYYFMPLTSQGQGTKGGQAVYLFTHVRDTTNRAQVYEEILLLQFTSNASLYRNYSKYYDDSLFNDNMAKAKAGLPVQVSSEPIRVKKSTIEQLMYQFDADKSYFIHPWVGETLVIENPIEKIQWTLGDSSIVIGGLSCYKASGNFKGRTYDVWYCPDYPVKAGPWKLNGLPGLIVEATDRTRTVSFKLSAIYSNNMARLELPALHKKITKAKFNSLIEDLKQNPNGYINAAMNGLAAPGAGTNTSISVNTNPSATARVKNKVNNPLELAE
jgi:GLPGLI family protein